MECFDDIHPVSVAVDLAGHVYMVSDSYNHLQVYDASGAFLTSLGYTCCSQLWYPVGVAVDRNGNVYMSEQFNHRVRKYAPGVPGWKQTNINGFGDRNNLSSALRMNGFGNFLYAGTTNE